MKTTNQRSLGRQALYLAILFAVSIFIAESLLSVFFYQKTGPEKLASIELLKTLKKTIFRKTTIPDPAKHNLVRPNSSSDINYRIAEETVRSNKYIHESWVEYRNVDFNGQYMHMDGQVRRSVPAAHYSKNAVDTIDIFFFGGSTMFGFNLQDHETIPSRLVEIYRKRHDGKKSIRVFNYGNPTYYTYQELILFADLVFKGHKPDVVIFLDGLNDFWFATASYYRQSYFSYIFRQVFNRGLRSKGDFQFVDTVKAMYSDRPYIGKEEYETGLVQKYFENIRNIQLLADMIGARAYFFCQPSPFYNYPNQNNDPMCYKDTNTRFSRIYPMVEKKGASIERFTFLGNMLKSENGYPFVDGLDYSPAFIEKVADQILISIEKEFTTDVIANTSEPQVDINRK